MRVPRGWLAGRHRVRYLPCLLLAVLLAKIAWVAVQKNRDRRLHPEYYLLPSTELQALSLDFWSRLSMQSSDVEEFFRPRAQEVTTLPNLIIAPRSRCKEGTFLVVLVISPYHDQRTREVVRDTWVKAVREGLWPGGDFLQVNVEVFFVLGIEERNKSKMTHAGSGIGSAQPASPTTRSSSDSSTVAAESLWERVQVEALENDDLIVGDFQDSYKNLTLKTLTGLTWATDRCPSASFVLKVDQDTLVDFARLTDFLLQHAPPSRFRSHLSGDAARADDSQHGSKREPDQLRSEDKPISGVKSADRDDDSRPEPVERSEDKPSNRRRIYDDGRTFSGNQNNGRLVERHVNRPSGADYNMKYLRTFVRNNKYHYQGDTVLINRLRPGQDYKENFFTTHNKREQNLQQQDDTERKWKVQYWKKHLPAAGANVEAASNGNASSTATRMISNAIIGSLYLNGEKQKEGKWAMGDEQYPFPFYPPFAGGPCYVLTADAARKIVQAARYLPLLPLEDVHVTGVLAEATGVERLHMQQLRNWKTKDDHPCDLVGSEKLERGSEPEDGLTWELHGQGIADAKEGLPGRVALQQREGSRKRTARRRNSHYVSMTELSGLELQIAWDMISAGFCTGYHSAT